MPYWYNLNMSEIALYRKYRPNCFKQIIAQDYVITTLKNEIVSGNLYHAYIFSGTRGSGKTSMGRIFARAINCLDNVEGDCCNKCSNCLETLETSSLDIYEIDAASNSGVDEVRKLIETVNYLPTKLNKKIYIIDEAHMLSNSAWNALLKTIEEPPSHVTFIFATTEVNKIPMTIISRCQRFDFSQLNLDSLVQLITFVTNKEDILIANDACIKIAQLSEGSARDCLSILQQVANYSNNNITIEHINEIFGLMALDFKIDLLNSFSDPSKINSVIVNLENNVSNYLMLAKDLVDILMDKLIYAKTNNINLLKVLSISDTYRINLSEDLMYELIDVLNDIYEKIKQFNNGKFYFKNTILNLIYKHLDPTKSNNQSDALKHTENNKNTSQENMDDESSLINAAFKTKTVTNQYVKENKETSTVSNDEQLDIKQLDYQKIFNQIVSNEDIKKKEELVKSLKELQQNIKSTSHELAIISSCLRLLVASKNAAILLFEYKNEAKSFNELFWSKEGYNLIKKQLLNNNDYLLIGCDKLSIKKWRDEYLNHKNNKYLDVDLSILNNLKLLTEDEQLLKIMNIINNDKKE